MNEDMMMRSFLDALAKISMEHQIFIGGCGCCGSPWVQREDCVSGYYKLAEVDGQLVWEET